MADTSFIIAGAGASVDTTAGPAWSNPSNIVADDNTYATQIFSSAVQGDDLKASNFGFSIPNDATIDGIIVRAQLGEINDLTYSYVNIGKDDSTLATAKNPAVALTAALTTNYDQGNAIDLWGMSWTPAEINASTFQARLRLTANSGGVDSGFCDAIWIQVFYTPAASANTFDHFVNKTFAESQFVRPRFLIK